MADNDDDKVAEPCDDVTAQDALGPTKPGALPGASRPVRGSKLTRRADANEPRLKELIHRRNQSESKHAKPTPFSANAEMETLANQIAGRYNLRRVSKGRGKGWTAVILLALRRAADESSFLAAVERQHAAEEKTWAERYEALAARFNNSADGEPSEVNS